jgi:hypothetical protein
MIKDLRLKVEALETTVAFAEHEGIVPSATKAFKASAGGGSGANVASGPLIGSPGGVAAQFSDLATLSAADLRTRYPFINHISCSFI